LAVSDDQENLVVQHGCILGLLVEHANGGRKVGRSAEHDGLTRNPGPLRFHDSLHFIYAFPIEHFETVLGGSIKFGSESLHGDYLVCVPLEKDVAYVQEALLLLVEGLGLVGVHVVQTGAVAGVSVAGGEVDRHHQVHLQARTQVIQLVAHLLDIQSVDGQPAAAHFQHPVPLIEVFHG